MLINDTGYRTDGNVELVSYDGYPPNYCRGTLVLRVNDMDYRFGYDADCDAEPFWEMDCDVWDSDACSGEWIIDAGALPEELRGVADRIEELMTSKLDGCGSCGGCA